MQHLTKEQLSRYSRHFVLPQIGVSGQKRLLKSKVIVIGAGALGSSALMYMASAGVGKIGIADFDSVELSNLQRQIIHSTSSVGKSKVTSAAETIKRINPDVNIVLYNQKITFNNIREIISEYDFVIDGSDNFETKFLINDACVLEKIPYSHAGAVRFEGQTFTYIPQQSPCLRCVLNTVPPTDSGCTCSSAGVLGVIPGILGSIQALEAIKYLLGIGELLNGRILCFDGIQMSFRSIRIHKADPICPVCGSHPSITSLSDNQTDYEPRNLCSLNGGKK